MRDSKGRFIKGYTPFNKGVKDSTGNHRGENNSYHKLTDEQRTKIRDRMGIMPEIVEKVVIKEKIVYKEKKKPKVNDFDDY